MAFIDCTTYHDSLMARASDDGGEDCPWCVITGETGLAHARAVVHHQSCYFIVAHVGFLVLLLLLDGKKKSKAVKRR